MRIDELQKVVTDFKKKEEKNVSVVIHDVHILDSSGSMTGGKYKSAIAGINADIEASKQSAIDNPLITSTMTIAEFSSSFNGIRYHNFMLPIHEVTRLTSHIIGGMTALHQTIGEVIERILIDKSKTDKVLLKIFTDGDENNSQGKYKPLGNGSNINFNPKLKELIEKVQKEDNFTVTFVGTSNDTSVVIRDLGINKTNTLVHDNTSKGVEKAYLDTVASRGNFLSKALRGENTKLNFYSKALK